MKKSANYLPVFILLILIISGNHIYAQGDIILKQLSVEQGLPGDNVRSIFQDSYGYVWFGIESAGLCKYDGNRFYVHGSSGLDSASISNTFINAMIEDDNGDIWLATENGLNIFDHVTGNFIKYFCPEINHNKIQTIYKDSQGSIWLGTFNGTMRFNPRESAKKTEEKKYGCPNRGKYYDIDKDYIVKRLNSLSVNNILEDNKDFFWFGTDKGLFNYNFKTSKMSHWPEVSIEEGFSKTSMINEIIKVSPGYLLIGTDHGLSLLNTDKNTFITLSFEQSGIFRDARVGIISIFMDKEGVTWIGTNSNGLITGPVSNLQEGFPKIVTPKNVYGLTSSHIRDIFEDKTGQIWIITKYDGIFKYDRRSQLFPHYTLKNENSNFIISAFEMKNGNILFGSKYGGLFEFDRENKTFKQGNIYVDNILTRRIECLYQDEDGTIWLGIKRGILKLDKNKQLVKIYPTSKVHQIFRDSKNILWIGTETGIYHLDSKTDNPERYKLTSQYGLFQNEELVICVIKEDSYNNLWFGTNNHGAYYYKRDDDKLQQFVHDINDTASISDNTIRSILEDSRGRIWIGTKFNGLNLYNPMQKKFTHYTKSDGLPSNTVFSILEDKTGHIWLTTNNGVSRLHPETKRIVNFNKSHGLQGNVFEPRTSIKLKDDYILFGGNEGFNIFLPENVDIDSFSPPLAITRITANGKILAKDLFSSSRVKISYRDAGLIAFEFASLDFRDPPALSYQYQLVGADINWVSSETRNYVTYTGLSHGKYVFKFKATNADGIWSPYELNTSIIIQRPIWQSWWAYVIYSVMILGILAGIYFFATIRANYSHQLHTKELELKKNEELNQMKLRFFTNISHEIRTPLSLILAPLQKLLKSEELTENLREKLSLINRSTKRLLNLTDQLLYFRKSQQANLKLAVSKGDIINFLDEIVTLYHELADSYNINLEFITDFDKLELWFDPDKIEKIISNLLSNALKFTPKNGSIILHIHKNESLIKQKSQKLKKDFSDNYLKITIQDSGIGMTTKQLRNIFTRFYQAESIETGVGIGLELVNSLIESHKGKISVTSEPGHGTCFSIYLPCSKSCFKDEEIMNEVVDTAKYISRIEPLLLFSKESKSITYNQTNETDNQKPRLLIVEDNNDLVQYLKLSLSSEYNLDIAVNGQEGLRKVLDFSPDIIVSDVMMPVMDGNEFCRNIKSNINTSHIPVVMLTAKILDEHQIEGFASGADDYITKPFSIDVLNARIKNLVDSRKKLHERFSNSLNVIPKEITTNKLDEEFLKRIIEIIDKDISNPELTVSIISEQLNMDRTNLFKKIKNLVGKSPSQFIREYRIKCAAKLLLENKYNINEISYMVGFASPAYFSKIFREVLGKTPTELIYGKSLNKV
ncbi:MAG: response regulator [Bacteroidales bacterium]|nr:response regulator [Bacteroidales bacterium]